MELRHSNNADKTGEEKIVIRGLVIPADWDDTGNVVAVSIASFNEDKYLVTDNPAGKELLNFIEHEVTVVGTLNVVGTKIYLTISDFFSFGSNSGLTPDN
ncbi:MAG: hypothetical protein P1P89_07080 [Desulfobacterales bacterium]|nr:hypothetical protein [Desulfobacterales bacterium]